MNIQEQFTNPHIDIEAARAVPIIDLIRRYVPDLKRQGSEYKCLCPFHNEKSPSFTVNQDRAFYHCFGCGVHGDVIDFVQAVDNGRRVLLWDMGDTKALCAQCGEPAGPRQAWTYCTKEDQDKPLHLHQCYDQWLASSSPRREVPKAKNENADLHTASKGTPATNHVTMDTKED